MDKDHTLSARKDIVSHISLFAELTADEQIFISNILLEKHFPKNSHITQQNCAASELFLISHGKVSIQIRQADDSLKEIRELSQFNFFGEISWLLQKPLVGTMIAKTDCQCYFLSTNSLQMLNEQQPEIASKIMAAISELTLHKIQHIFTKILKVVSQPTKNISTAASLPNQTAPTQTLSNGEIHSKLIHSSAIFSDFTIEQLTKLIHYYTPINYAKWYKFSLAEHSDIYCSIVYSGAIQLKLVVDHYSSPMQLLSPGQAFSAGKIIQRCSSHIVAIAREKTTLLIVDNKQMQKMRQADIQLWHLLHKIICRETTNFLSIVNRQLIWEEFQALNHNRIS